MRHAVERMPLIGERLPRMDVPTTHGPLTLPDHFRGKWTVLFSHPADFTPVCTTEFVAFQTRYDQFRELNTELIGLSIDQVFAHISWERWIEQHLNIEVEFPIIADTGEVAERLGMIHPGKASNTVRAVFVVDPDSTIRAILYYPQELGRNIDEIVRMVHGFQVSDEEDVALPAGWPENEIIGDRIILPPPSDAQTAEARLAEDGDGCYDWWFCHRERTAT